MVFKIDTDVKVQILAPNAGEFTLNFSLLNGTDTLGIAGAAKTWVDIKTEVVSFDYQNGVNPGEAYFRPIAATATIKLRSKTYNPDLNDRIYVGLPLRVQVNAISGFSNLFVGYVTGMSTSYVPGYQYPEITLQLTDTLESLLNTVLVVDYPAQTAQARANAITASLASFGINQRIYLGAWAADQVKAVNDTLTVQELLEPILQRYRTYSQQIYYDAVTLDGITYYDTYVLNIQPQSDTIPPAPRTYKLTDLVPGTNETSYASLETNFDATLLVNQVVLEDEIGAVIAQENNFDSQQLSGIQALTNVWYFTNNLSIAPAWAQTLVQETDTKTYSNIQFDALDQNKNLKNITDYLVTNYGVRMVDLIQTKYGINNTISALVTRQTHNITADGWLVTLDLWKGKKF